MTFVVQNLERVSVSESKNSLMISSFRATLGSVDALLLLVEVNLDTVV